MRRVIGISLALAVLLCACGREEWQNLRQFCETYSALAEKTEQLATIGPEQFMVRRSGGTAEYQAWLGESMLLACNTLDNGRVHTVTLTGLAEQRQSEFTDAASCIIRAYTGAAPDQAERWLRQLQAGQSEVLGVQSLEESGFRISCAANKAGRWLRVSQLRFLPAEAELPTLRENITEE